MTKIFKNKTLLATICILLCVTLLGLVWLTVGANKVNILKRDVKLSQQQVDIQSIFDGFEDVKLETKGSLTVFEGSKSLDLLLLNEIDNLNESDLQQIENTKKSMFFLMIILLI